MCVSVHRAAAPASCTTRRGVHQAPRRATPVTVQRTPLRGDCSIGRLQRRVCPTTGSVSANPANRPATALAEGLLRPVDLWIGWLGSGRSRCQSPELTLKFLPKRQLAERVQLVEGAMGALDHPWNDLVAPVTDGPLKLHEDLGRCEHRRCLPADQVEDPR